MEHSVFHSFELLEPYVDSLCQCFPELFPSAPSVLLDKTFQTLMITPTEGDCCPEPRYQCLVQQEKFWANPAHRGKCILCQNPFKAGRKANATWLDAKEEYLEQWIEIFFSKMLQLPAEPATRAAHVALLLSLSQSFPPVIKFAQEKCYTYIAQHAAHFALLPIKVPEEMLSRFCRACFSGTSAALTAITALMEQAASLKPFLQDCFNDVELFHRRLGFRDELTRRTSSSLKLLQLYVERDFTCPPIIFPWQGGWDSMLLPLLESESFARWPIQTLARFILSLCDWSTPERPRGTSEPGQAILNHLLGSLSDHFDVCWTPLRTLAHDLFDVTLKNSLAPVDLPFQTAVAEIERRNDVDLAAWLLMSGTVAIDSFSSKFLESVTTVVQLHLRSVDFIIRLSGYFKPAQICLLRMIPHLSDEFVAANLADFAQMFFADLDCRTLLLQTLPPLVVYVGSTIESLARFWPKPELVSWFQERGLASLQTAPKDFARRLVASILGRNDIDFPELDQLSDSPTLAAAMKLRDLCQRADSKVDLICCGALKKLSLAELELVVGHASPNAVEKLLDHRIEFRAVNTIARHGESLSKLESSLFDRLRFGGPQDVCFVILASSSLRELSVKSRTSLITHAYLLNYWIWNENASGTALLRELFTLHYGLIFNHSIASLSFGSTHLGLKLMFPELSTLQKLLKHINPKWAFPRAYAIYFYREARYLVEPDIDLLLDIFHEDYTCPLAVYLICRCRTSPERFTLRNGKSVTPEQLLSDSIKLFPNLPHSYWMLATVQLPSGQHSTSQELLMKSIELDEKCYPALVTLGCSIAENATIQVPGGQSMSKRQLLLTCLHMRPTLPAAYLALGESLRHKELVQLISGETVTQQELFRRAIDLDPRFFKPYKHLAQTLSSGEKIRLLDGSEMSARQLLLKSIELAPKDHRSLANIYCTLAESLSRGETVEFPNGDGMTDQFLYLKSIELDPQSALAYYRLGQSLRASDTIRLANGDIMSQTQLYRRAIQLNPLMVEQYPHLRAFL